MARQKAIVISGATPAEFKANLDDWIANAEPQPYVDLAVSDLNNNRVLFIYHV